MRRLLLIPVLLACVGSASLAQDKKDKKDPAKDAVHVKVFRLQLCDPDEVTQVLDQLLEREPDAPDGGMLPIPPMAPPMMGMLPMVGMPPFALLPPEPPPPARVLADIRSGSVIVRGREEDLQVAAEIIGVLESPAGKPLPKTKLIEAIPLAHVPANEIATLTDGLDLPIRFVALNDLKMAIGFGSAEMLRKWGAMVRDLDVPERKLEMNKMRRLGVIGGNRAGAM